MEKRVWEKSLKKRAGMCILGSNFTSPGTRHKPISYATHQQDVAKLETLFSFFARTPLTPN
jgi:hypothetical protein